MQTERSPLLTILGAIYSGVAALLKGQADQQMTGVALAAAVQANSTKLDQILTILNEATPIEGATITFQEITMQHLTKATNKPKATVRFVLKDNGTATGTIAFTDAVGVPTTPAPGATVATVATSSDPGVTVSVDTTGLIVTAAPASPLPSPLPTGVVISCAITITNTDGSVISLSCDDSKDPLNVTAGGPAGATITFA